MRRSITALVVAAAVIAPAACGSDDSGDAGTTGGTQKQAITVGVLPIVDVAPIYLGVKQGFFTEQGLDVTLKPGQGGAAIVPGVMSGDFDFGFSNVVSLLIAKTKGLPLKVVAAGNSTTGKVGEDFAAVVVPKGSDIKDAKGLAGKSVAVNTLNNIGTTTVSKVVEDAGGDPKSIKFVELGFPDMPAALAQKRVDAAWVLEPFLTIARNQGATPVSWNYAATDPNLVIATYFTNEQTVKEKPDLVTKFQAAMTKSLEYAEAHPDEVRGIIGTYTQIDPGVAKAMVLPKFPTTVDADSVRLLADLSKKYGLVDSAPDVDALLK